MMIKYSNNNKNYKNRNDNNKYNPTVNITNLNIMTIILIIILSFFIVESSQAVVSTKIKTVTDIIKSTGPDVTVTVTSK